MKGIRRGSFVAIVNRFIKRLGSMQMLMEKTGLDVIHVINGFTSSAKRRRICTKSVDCFKNKGNIS